MNAHRRLVNGFTLIEVLTVLAIMTVVSTLGAVAFVRVNTHWNDVYAHTALHGAADAVFAQVRADFANLLSPARVGIAISGRDAVYTDPDESGRFWRISFSDDRVTLPVEEFDVARGVPVRRLVTYRVRRDGALPVLVRAVAPLAGGDPEEEGAPLPGDARTSALALKVSYGEDGQWFDAWDHAHNPDLVRISLTLVDANRFFEQIAREIVVPVHVE